MMLFAVQSEGQNVIPIHLDILSSPKQQQIADLAFEFWLLRRFQKNGSPEACYLQAVLELTFGQEHNAADVRPGIKTGIRCLHAKKRVSNSPPEAA